METSRSNASQFDYGPFTFDYDHSLLFGGVHSTDSCNDFTSGSLFKYAMQQFARSRPVKYDVFLSLGTYSLQAFRSTVYPYWSCCLQTLNLPPSESFKQHNVLPVTSDARTESSHRACFFPPSVARRAAITCRRLMGAFLERKEATGTSTSAVRAGISGSSR